MNEPEPTSVAATEAPEAAAGPETAALTPARTPPAEATPADESRRLKQQEWCLLDQLLQAVPGHKLPKGQANKKLTKALQRDLGLTTETANRLRESLAEKGYIRITKKGQNVTYELTDAGREYLQTLEPYPPQPEVEPVSEEVQRYQTAYLLFQLFRAKDGVLTRGKANKTLGPTDLELKPAAANQLRRKLAQQGILKIDKGSRSESYRLTPGGEEMLAALRHYPTTRFWLTGRQLNALLDRVSGAAMRQPEAPPTTSAQPQTVQPPADLSRAVYDEFEELRRERHGHTGLVPIHEIRARIAEKYGPQAARHDVLDEPIRELWRQGRVRLVSLADLQKATPEQLNNSVPGVNETLFFMEVARDHSVPG